LRVRWVDTHPEIRVHFPGFHNGATTPLPPKAMASSYLPVLMLLGVSIINAVGMFVASQVLNPRRPTSEKDMPYESGMIPLGDTQARFSVKFYMVAISFIIFDLEAVFLLPWAVAMRTLGWEAFIAVLIFTAVLVVGLIYEWKKGGLDWE